jgi:putative membrane protein
LINQEVEGGRKRNPHGSRTTLLLLLLIITTILSISTTVSANGDDDHMGGGGMMDWGWFGFPFMWLWMGAIWLVFIAVAFLVYKDAEERGMNGLLWFFLVVLPWIGILSLIVYLIARNDKLSEKIPQKSAYSILDERYARGEITSEDYKRMKKDIRNEGV